MAIDPNAPTPEELAFLNAQTPAAPAPVSPVPAAPVTPAPAPVPVPVPAPAPVAVDPNAPTPEELAFLNAQKPKVINPAMDMTADEMATLAVEAPDRFKLLDEFNKVPPRSNTATLAESQAYNKILEKFAEARHKVRERGFSLQDLPSVGQAGTAVKDVAVGFGKQAWNYAMGFAATQQHLIASAVEKVTGLKRPESMNKAYDLAQRGVAENLAGSEASITGIAGMAQRTKGKIRRFVGQDKALTDYTIDDKVRAFTDELKAGEATSAILKGQGPATQAIGGHVIADLAAKGLPIRPEETSQLAAGDPFAFYGFGKLMGAPAPLIRAVSKPLAGVISKTGQAIVNVAPKVVGRTIEATADLAALGAKAVEKTATLTGSVIGAAKGFSVGGIGGAIGGVGLGAAGGRAIAKGAATVRGVAEKVAGFGEQVSGKAPLTSSYAQGVRSVAEALPGASKSLAEGFGMDVGLAAVSSESPEDTQGAIGLGTFIGVGTAGGKIIRQTVSGQIVGPRAYEVATPVPTSKAANTSLAAMHATAFQALSPGQRARVNATRKFMQGAVPNADFFAAADAPAVKAVLMELGLSAAQADNFSKAEGFFTVELPGADGNPRKVIIARNVDAAPHESFHAVQDVLGETANRALDAIVKREYADTWDAEGKKYADRLPNSAGKEWGEAILDDTGWGRLEVAEKMFRELTKSNEEQGNPPDPELIKRLVQQEITQLETDALQRNPMPSKSGVPPTLEAAQAHEQNVRQGIWRDVLSADEAKAVAERYLSRELAAENFDIVFKSQGAGLQEGKALPQRLARVVASLITALGGNPLEGTTSQIGKVEPRLRVMEAVAEAGRGRLPVIEPAAPRAPGKAPAAPKVGKGSTQGSIPVTPEQQAAAAIEAQAIADAAPDVVSTGALPTSESPRAMLGTVAQAITDRSGVKINYRSAADGVPAADTASNSKVRAAVVEAWRTMPESAKALWEKNFFPEKVRVTNEGEYQVQGWAPEVFASNAHKMAQALINTRKGDWSPYALDPTTGSFTTEGWQRLFEDTQKFVQNQMSGRTGSGEELVVPRSVVDAGGYKPPLVGEAQALGQSEADFINMLFNFKLPKGTRMKKGKRPLNIQGQEVSEASIPGRTETVLPRKEYTGPEATAQDIAGRPIKEVNPTRGSIEAALGEQMPSMNVVWQNLNLKSINDVAITPEQPQFRGNTLTLSAGFMPKARDKGYVAREMWLGRDKLNPAPEGHHEWAVENFPGDDAGQHRAAAYERAKSAGYLRVVQDFGALAVDNSPKYPTWDTVPRGYKAALEAKAVDNDLRVTFNGKEVIKKFRPGDGGVQFQAQTATGKKFEKDGFKFRVARPESGGYTIEMLRNNEQVGVLEAANEGEKAVSVDWVRVVPEFRKQGLSEVMYRELAARLQKDGIKVLTGIVINEGPIQTRQKLFGEPTVAARLGPPGAKFPVEVESHIDPTVQFSPKKVAEDYAKKAGIEYAPKGGVRSPDEGMLRDVADFYESAEHAPDDPKVKASYDALANETVAQYEAIKDAGYTIEPWTEAGEPYKSSAEMTKDVQDNKHLFFRQTEGTFKGAEDNLMLQDSGIEIDGQPVNVNDIFRAVHDFFGHAKEDYQFGPRGEFSAWRAHSDMYSPEAQGALAAETLAQNAWVNYGPQLRGEGGKVPKQGESGFVAPPDRPFAEQKNIVVPPAMIKLGKAQMMPASLKGKVTKESVDEILAMPASDWTTFMREYEGEHANSATGIAIDIGKLAKTPEDLLALRVGSDMAAERYKQARAAGDLDTAMAEAMRKQTFEEAIQTAEGTRPMLNKLAAGKTLEVPTPEPSPEIEVTPRSLRE